MKNHMLTVVLTVLLCAATLPAKEISVELGDGLAGAMGVEPASAKPAGAMSGSYWTIGENFNLAIAPAAPAGRATMVDGRYVVGLGMDKPPLLKDITQIRYSTRTAKMPANVNVTFAIYTAAGSDPALGKDDGEDFQRKLTHEPLYMFGRKKYDDFFKPDAWNEFTAFHDEHPMAFYDAYHGPAGYTGPSLEQIQNADSTSKWTEFGEAKNKFDDTPYAYGNSEVKYFALQTSSDEGNWKNFKADIDTLVVEMKNGDVIVVDFNHGKDSVTVESAPGSGGASVIGYIVIGVLIAVIAFVALLASRKARKQAG